MYRSLTTTPSNKRVFGACLLSFMMLITPLASIAAPRRYVATKPPSVPSKESNPKSDSLPANEADLFVPAADPGTLIDLRFAHAAAAVTAVSFLPPAAGDVTATMVDSQVAVVDDLNSDGNADPGEKIAYSVLLNNPAIGSDASGLSFNVPLDSHTTLVPGSIQSTPVTFDKVVPAFNEDAAAQAIVLQGQDPDGTNLTFAIVTGPTKGTLGSIDTPSCNAAGVCSATVNYTPTANEFGADSFTFKVNDGTADSNQVGNVSITINSVNDAPSFTTPGNPAAVNEDVAGQTVTPFVTDISKGPANESGQTVDFVIDSNSHSALFAVQPAISAAGTLTYTPAANANGTALITYHLHDDGGTANGGVNISSPNQTFTITVNAVNDAPVAQNKAFTVESNMKISGLTGLLSGVTDPDATNGAADPLSFDAAAPAYTTPSVSLNNIAVNTCQNAGPPATTSTVTVTNASTGTFNFDPSPGMTGTCVLKYQVTDTGKGSGGNQTSVAADITITHTGPVIWFVDPNRATDGNGTLSDTSAAVGPFKLLSSANAKLATLAANQRVFVYNTASTVIGATEVLLLQGGANQAAAHWLIGQGTVAADFDTLFGINGAVPAGTIGRPSINGTRSTIRGTVNMRNNTRVEGVNIDVTGAAAGSKGLTNNSVALSAGSVLTIKDVNITTAAGSAVDFNNAQTISYTSSASNVNILSSGTGIALSVVNTTIGAGGLNFRSISSNGASSGIVLNNTGASGSLVVAGNGGSCTSTATCTGGAIQNSTSHGVSLTSTLSPSFTRMAIQATSGSGVSGTDVTNFTFQNGFIDNSGSGLAAGASNLSFSTL
ncbi:MAG TPA: Ig-like domain-containing protein, partial [Pyrinomonadaceae bacterium]|nr:Ig-like domain-containing protein [Pyrinomonadaceae bacterium]